MNLVVGVMGGTPILLCSFEIYQKKVDSTYEPVPVEQRELTATVPATCYMLHT